MSPKKQHLKTSSKNIIKKPSSPSLMLEPFNEDPSLSAATGVSKNSMSQKTPSKKKAIEKSADSKLSLENIHSMRTPSTGVSKITCLRKR